MDAYLKCLYNHIQENLLKEPFPHKQEYHALLYERDRAREAFEATLSEEQTLLWESFQSAFALVLDLEDERTFERAVALGKWMVLS